MTGAYGGNPLDPNVPPLPFVARPTGSSPTGIAPGFGLEKIVEKLTDFGRLVGSKVRSFEDLALSMGGTGQLMARNVAENAEASPQSALLRAGRWTGLAAHTLRNIDSIYMEYRTGGQKSLEVAGVNVPMTMMRVGSVFKKPANNLMTPQEFMREVSRAHKRDRLEHENPFVLKAAQETRKFYDEMRNAGIEVNQIMTLDTVKRSLDRMTSWTSGHQNRINQIEGKAKDSEGNINTKLLSNNELAELKVLREAVLHGRQRTQFYSGALTFMENKQKPGPKGAPGSEVDASSESHKPFLGPENEQFYLQRIWNLDKILADEAGDKILRKVLTNWFLTNPLTPDEAKLDRAIAKMNDINLSIDNKKQRLKDIISSIESSIETTQKYVSYLERKFEEVGLTEKEIATLDYFKARSTMDGKSKASDLLDDQAMKDVDAVNGEQNRVYHGTRAQDGFVDKDGNLILKPSANFGGVQNGVSFSPDLLASADYAARVRGGGPNNFDFSNAIVFSINKDSIPNKLIKISDSEFFSETGEAIVIPAGQFEVIKVRDTPAGRRMLSESRDAMAAARGLSDNELVDILLSPPTKISADKYFAVEALGSQAAAIELKARIRNSDLYKNRSGEIDVGSISERNLIESVLDDMGFSENAKMISASLDLAGSLPNVGKDTFAIKTKTIVGPTASQAQTLENLREQLFNTTATKKQRDYLAILDRQAQGELLKKASVARAEARAAGMGMGGMEESIELKAIEARVNRTIANILKEAEQGELSVGRSNREFLISRDLNIPNELVWDFIEDDVGSLIRSYSHRAGRAFEYARMFGERDAKESIYDSAINAARELKGSPDFIAQEVSKLIGHAENLRDFTLGDVYSKNPLSLTRKAAQALSAFGTVTSLGGALISSLNEITRPIMMHGINRTIGFAFNALSDREAFKGMSYELKTLTGQGWDTALGMTMSRFGEQGGPMNGAIDWAGKALDKTTRPLINFANGPYFVANLLGPFTDILKNYSNVMNAHFFIEDAKAIVDGTASKRVRGNFTAAGLDIDDAARILAMPVEKDRALNVTNLAAWGDAELSRKFASAIASKTMQQVVTATEADMPNITRGFIGRGEDRREIALLRLPFQFMNYSFAALNKNLLSALQGREANVFAGLTAMVGAAYLSQYLKASSSAWDKTPMEERLLRSIEGSGMLSLFGDINQKIEGLSRNEYGARSVLGMPPKYGDFSLQQNPAGDIMGPAFGKVTDLFGVVFDKDQNQKQDIRAIRRSIPLNDIFYMKSIFNYGEKAALD